MNIKKLLAGLAVLAVIVGVSAGSVFANSDNSGSDVKVGLNANAKVNVKAKVDVEGMATKVSVNANGKVDVSGAKITSVSSSSISAASTIGSTTLNWVVTIDQSTKLLRRFDGASSVAEMSVGDIVSFRGTLTSGQPLTVRAQELRDLSIQKRNAAFSGSVLSIDAGARTFVLSTKERGNLKVIVSDASQFTGKASTTSFADIQIGGKIEASGVWDTTAGTLAAQKIKVHALVPVKMTIEGAVKSVVAANASTTGSLVLGKSGVDYTVNVASDTAVLNSHWLRIPFGSIKTGDNVRAYGSLTGTTMNATVVRDTSIRL